MLAKGSTIDCSKCGAVAFLVVRDIHEGDFLDPDLVTHPDGRPCQDGDPMRCPNCGHSGDAIWTDGTI